MMMRTFTVLVVMSGVAACGGRDHGAEARNAIAVPVTVAEAQGQSLPEAIEIGGTLRARATAVLTSRIIGDVRDVRVLPGARVTRGQVLATLDGRELAANRARADAMAAAALQSHAAAAADRAAADAALALATATHARIVRLHATKSATAHELDEAEAALTGARARADAAAASLAAASSNISGASAAADAAQVAAGYSRITAPFDGRVTEKHVDPGMMTMPGTPVLTVEQAGEYHVEVRMDDARAARIDWEIAPAVRLDGVPGPIAGRVVERAHALDAAHTVIVKVALPADAVADARTGMFARVSFSGPSRQGLAIPVDALIQRGQLDAVWVVQESAGGDDARVVYRVVEAGERSADLVEIRAGLSPGERVVRRPPASLADGSTVTLATGSRR
jgi:membrane fusion protein, multidrug efflux system